MDKYVIFSAILVQFVEIETEIIFFLGGYYDYSAGKIFHDNTISTVPGELEDGFVLYQMLYTVPVNCFTASFFSWKARGL